MLNSVYMLYFMYNKISDVILYIYSRYISVFIPKIKLEYYGIKGSAYNLLESYLVKHEQYVRFKNYNQSKLKQNQESLKGPFLAHYCFVSTLMIWFLLVIRYNIIFYFTRFSIP